MPTDEATATAGPRSPPPASPYHEADLTKGMEHLRPYVSVPVQPSTSPQTPSTSSTTHLTTEPSTVYGIPSSLVQPQRHPASSTRSNAQKRRDPFQFGSRYLEQDDDIFEFNAWDHVTVDEQYTSFAETQYTLQRSAPVAATDLALFNDPGMPAKWWDRFYAHNKSSFFKDRKWLFQEFPVLEQVTRRGAGDKVVLEVGAGAGNTAFPVLKQNENTLLQLWAVDFAHKAVEVMREADEYAENVRVAESEGRRANVHVEWYDLAGEPECVPEGLGRGTVDVLVLVFTFSALAPGQWDAALRNVWALLRPGGVVLFRDYGRGDLAQVRFKKGRWLQENFYVRGDGTRVYFFAEDELRSIWGGERPLSGERQGAPDAGGDAVGDSEAGRTPGDGEAVAETVVREDTPRFKILDLAVDRRMLVNRKRRLKMYRCWLQGRFQKPFEDDTGTS